MEELAIIDQLDIDYDKKREITSIIEYILSCESQIKQNIYSQEYSINKECYKNLLFMLTEKNYEDFIISEIYLDNGFYIHLCLFQTNRVSF